VDRVLVEPLRQQRRVRHPGDGGTPTRLTYHTGNDEVVGWSRDSQSVLFRAARGDGAFPNVATLYEVAVDGGPETAAAGRLGLLGHYLARRQVARLQPPSRRVVAPALSRQLRRRSVVANIAQKTYTELLADERYNRYWPLWAPTTRSTSSPIRSPTTRASARQRRRRKSTTTSTRFQRRAASRSR
jgi:hypothetical protein